MKILIIFLAIICSSVNVFAAPVGISMPIKKPSVAPMNPRFAEHIMKRIASRYTSADNSVSASSAKEVSSSFSFTPGLVPEPFIMPKSAKISVFSEDPTLPTSYDLRTTGKMPPIRNQSSCGSCWAFATYGSLESSLLPGESWDFSENNLKNLHGFDWECCDGGNRAMSTAYLARWDGPINETDDPYDINSCTSASGFALRKHIQDVLFLPDRASSLDNDTIKNAVMTYGAVYVVFSWSSSYYNSSTYGYYCSSVQEHNHAVCIVGWDDNYSKSNFLSAPSDDGAFLIRNSWGTWGDAGYFWISYYDANLGKAYSSSAPNECAVFLAESPNKYDAQYGYDTLGLVNTLGYGTNSAWAAMEFTPGSNGVLQAASTYFMIDSTSYDLRIYEAPGSKPTSGTLVSSKTGTVSIAGYHTIELDTPVLMTSGTKYACVIKLTTPGYNYPLGCEYPYTDYSSAATANAGETYISSNGSQWQDLVSWKANASVCLKTFASIPDIVSVVDVKGTSDGDYVRLDGVVISAIYDDCLYVQDPDLPTGIRVDASATGYSLGDVVSVIGTIGTYRPDGVHDAERQIESALLIAQ